MRKDEMDRVRAVQRVRAGETIAEVCGSLGYSRRWLYKWLSREEQGDDDWYREESRSPRRVANKTSVVSEELVVRFRCELDAADGFCGAQAISWEFEQLNLKPPSLTTINRILSRNGLIERGKKRYQAKGRKYPVPDGSMPNGVHQMDFVGPRYLGKGVRFYAINCSDVATSRSTVQALKVRDTTSVLPALWRTWTKLGFPRVLQLDNDLVFWGSRRHPRGLSQFIRLCLQHQVEPLFIPPAEPWRNGVVEKFNDYWQDKCLARHTFKNLSTLVVGCSEFEAKHNGRWRYRKNGGVSPNEALRRANVKLRFPSSIEPPTLPVIKPESGRYHLVRFIRSDLVLDIFGQRFSLPPEAAYEYVTATVEIEQQQLFVRIDHEVIECFDYLDR